MPTIFYGLAGEGLGHTSRALAILSTLPDCDVHIFTHGDAYRYLDKIKMPNLHRVAGLEYEYTYGRVSLVKSAIANRGFLRRGLADNIRDIVSLAERHRPSLFLCDYEPSIPRAADKLGIPCVSVDNQHKFSHCDNRDLPIINHCHAAIMGVYGNLLVPKVDKVVVTTFHRELIKIRPELPNVHLVNSVIRKEVREHPVSNEGHGLLYIRKKDHEARLLAAIADIKQPVKIYGAHSTESWEMVGTHPHFTFCNLGPSFVADLAMCDWVVGTSGHQLISEARFLGKRMLMVPEPGQPEQAINAIYAERLGIGQTCQLSKLTSDRMVSFCRDFTISPDRATDGTPQVTEILRGYLS